MNQGKTIESKIKIIKANIVFLEKQLSKEESDKIKNKLIKEKIELEKLKDSNPEFFV